MKKQLLAAIALSFTAVAQAGVNVWTHRNDNNRTGANLSETQLTPANVNTTQFGKLWDYEVDSSVYAQPLIIQNVSIPGLGVHNVLLVATMNNTVYAFDADNNNGANVAPLWETNFNDPAADVMPVPAPDVEGGYTNIDPLTPVGIMSTPVVDTVTNTVYLLARTKEHGTYVQRLHALDLTTGAERPSSPVTITASVPGNAYDAVGGMVSFNPRQEGQRSALGLSNGKLLIAWGALADLDPYHGWVMVYNPTTLQQLGAFNTTAYGSQGGIWQSGDGPAFDASGNAYYAVGNGSYDGTSNFGESVLKFNLQNGLVLQDWFTPFDNANLSQYDLDLGVSGPLLIPNTSRVINGSKTGWVYVMNTATMGHLVASNAQLPQTAQLTQGHIHGSPVYYPYATQGPLVYMWSENDVLRGYLFNGSTLGTTPTTQSSFSAPPGMPGGFLSISANGSTPGTGILWASIPVSLDAENAVVPGVLRAFNASNLSTEIWDSQQNPTRDGVGLFAKYVAPTVANGKVYLATFSNKVRVYGLFASQSPAPTGTLTSTKVSSTASVNLTSVGTSDWTHWPGYVHKTTGGGQISDFIAMYPPDPTGTYGDDARTFSWTDGTPTTTGSGTTGVSVAGYGAGYQISAPADTTTRTLNVYLGGWNSIGKMRAYLSDGSAEDIVDVNPVGQGSYYFTYSFTYKAAHAGQLLYVEWTQAGANGNLTLAGATLSGGSTSTSTPPSQPVGLTASQGTSSSGVTVTWTPATGATLYTIYRSTTSGTQGTSVGTSSSATFTDTTVTAGITYWYSVVAANSAGSSPVSAQVSGYASTTTTSAPATPTNVSATKGTSSTTVTVSWTTVSGATTYTVYRSTASGTQGSQVGTATTGSYTDSTVVVGTTYYYSVVASNSAGSSAVSAQASGYAATSTAGAVSGAPSATAATASLTSVGTSDWAHWPEFTEKAAGGGQIGNALTVGSGSLGTYGNDPRTLTWTDGSPTASGTSTTGKYIAGVGSGFQVTAPADTTTRTLTLYVGGWSSSGQLTAHLSDGSAVDYVDSSVGGSGQYDATYAITYHAAAAGATLTVKWIQAAFNGQTNGNVTLSGAALSGGTVTSSPPASPAGVSATQGTSATGVTVSWTAVTGATSYTIYRSTASGTQGSSIGTSTTASYTDSTVVAGTTYFYSLTASNSAGTSAVSAQASGYATASSSGGSVTGAGTSTTATANLTTVGTSDWAHWPEFTEKSSGAAQITNTVAVGTGAVGTYGDDQRTLTWADGSPAVSGSLTTGQYSSGIGSGFQITAPADTTNRTLTLYVGGWSSNGKLTAHLSDGSAADYVDSTFSGSGQYDATYTITYHAASAGQTLAVSWTHLAFNGQTNGNVTLSGAALSGGGTTSSPPATPTGVSATQGASASSVTVTWTAVSGATSYTIYRSTASGTQGSSIGTSTTASYTDSTVVPGTTYYYSLTASNSGGTSSLSAQASGYASAGSVSGVGANTAVTANLTTVGTSDWAHWPEFTEKSTGAAQITNAVAVGTGSVSTYSDDLRTLTWSDGSPTLAGSLTTGKYSSGIGSGLQISAPADTMSRTLTVYVGGWSSTGKIVAHLSDGSAPDYIDSSFGAAGQYDATYTITYRAASAGQTITVSWTHLAFNGQTNGNVTLSGAALSGGTTTPSAPGQPTGVSATQGTSSSGVTVTWTAVSGATSYTIYRSTASGTQGSSVGTSTTASYTDGTVVAGTTYYYSLTASNSGGTGSLSAQASGYATAPSGSGTLTGSGTKTATTANLTTVGTSDWAHWPEFTEKSTGAAQITNATVIGTGTSSTYNDDKRTLTWSDGSPTLAGSLTTGKYISGINSGLQIIVPASATTRTLTLYVGGWASTGKLTAHLSDGSAPDYVDSSFNGNGQYDVTYTITYHAASAGQTLTLTWVHNALKGQSNGNVTLSGAALH